MQEAQDLSTPDQITRLRQQVAERELAVMRAVVSNSELHQKVAVAEEQTEKLKAQIRALEQQPFSPAAVAEIARLKTESSVSQKIHLRGRAEARAELLKVRSLVTQTQKRYDDEVRARRIETAHSSATIAKLERELGDLRLNAKQSRDAQAQQYRSQWKLVGGGIAALTAIAAFGLFWGARPMLAIHTRERAQTEQTQASGDVLNGREEKGFSGSLSHLTDVLTGFPNRSAEEVLRAVQKSRARDQPGVCAFQWNDGQPALLFGGAQPDLNIASTLNRCAEAVETYRTRKSAPASEPGH